MVGLYFLFNINLVLPPSPPLKNGGQSTYFQYPAPLANLLHPQIKRKLIGHYGNDYWPILHIWPVTGNSEKYKYIFMCLNVAAQKFSSFCMVYKQYQFYQWHLNFIIYALTLRNQIAKMYRILNRGALNLVKRSKI